MNNHPYILGYMKTSQEETKEPFDAVRFLGPWGDKMVGDIQKKYQADKSKFMDSNWDSFRNLDFDSLVEEYPAAKALRNTWENVVSKESWADVHPMQQKAIEMMVGYKLKDPAYVRQMVNKKINQKISGIKDFLYKNRYIIGGVATLPLLFILGRKFLGGLSGRGQQPMYYQPVQQTPIEPMRRFW